MRTLKEMTELEILALTDEQIEKIIKYRKAQEGIALIERPDEPTYEEEPKKDVTFYKLTTLDRVLFKSSEVASSIAEFINSKVNNDTYYASYGEAPKSIISLRDYEKDYLTTTVRSETYYSPEVFQEAKQIEKRNNEKRENYEKIKKEYESYTTEIQWLIDEVWDRVFEVRRKYARLLKLQNDYSEYLVLADGDEKIATNFLTKANTISEEEMTLIKGEKIIL